MTKVKTIGGIKPIGRCFIMNCDRKVIHNWPYFLRDGYWALTAHLEFGEKGPNCGSEWFTVTHLPTGYRAGDVRVDDPRKALKLAKFAEMFGKASTVAGVGRKYNQLPAHKRRWIKAQTAWLLPSKEVRGK